MVWVGTREMKEDLNRVCPQGAHSQEYEGEYWPHSPAPSHGAQCRAGPRTPPSRTEFAPQQRWVWGPSLAFQTRKGVHVCDKAPWGPPTTCGSCRCASLRPVRTFWNGYKPGKCRDLSQWAEGQSGPLQVERSIQVMVTARHTLTLRRNPEPLARGTSVYIWGDTRGLFCSDGT